MEEVESPDKSEHTVTLAAITFFCIHTGQGGGGSTHEFYLATTLFFLNQEKLYIVCITTLLDIHHAEESHHAAKPTIEILLWSTKFG